MAKKFFEVFPTLKLNERARTLLMDVNIEKVSTNTNRDYLHVHIVSTHLLSKKLVISLETAIKEQLFGLNPIQIKIVESYYLSSLYTPENLMKEYYDSILFELKKKSIVEYNMFLTAKYHFENENILPLP